MSNIKDVITEVLGTEENGILRSFFYSEISNDAKNYDSDEIIEFRLELAKKNLKFKYLDNYGGEDCGSEYWSVYEFSLGNESAIVKFNGWYQSYNGSEYTDWFFVKAVPKTGFDYVEEK